MNLKLLFIFFVSFLYAIAGYSQLSPGDLAEPHAHLEGLSNCTKCHTLGSKISNDKCLACHIEIKVRVENKTGYHSSSQVYKKSCTICHSDHHGRQYQIIRFDKSKFDHQSTGYKLEGKHSNTECSACHKSSNIIDPAVKKKKSTYLGLGRECLTCHEDYHRRSLSPKCSNCHTYDAFKSAPKFDHSKSNFALNGKHKTVPCIKCHEKSMVDGKEFQKFKGIKHNGCANCHKDVHNNRFGQQCSDCHTEESFRTIKSIDKFDHSLTGFKLEGRHVSVACNKCHKAGYSNQLKYDKCYDCHTDYHKGDFTTQNSQQDCSSCHDVNGFSPSSYTIERHNKSAFMLDGAHLATPCISCHKKNTEWKFRKIGEKCNDCHEDIHKEYLDAKYYPQSNCLSCHSVDSWMEIAFDHSKTSFPLEGKHKDKTCRDCHDNSEIKVSTTPKEANPSANNTRVLKFAGLPSECMKCHNDEHQGQFTIDGKTDCSKCHLPEGWKSTKFDHNKARFKLDGRHNEITCEKCHPIVRKEDKQYVLYKTGKLKCADCH